MASVGGLDSSGEASGGTGGETPSPTTGADSDGSDSGGLLSGIVDFVKQIAEGVEKLADSIVNGLSGFFDNVVAAVKAVTTAVGKIAGDIIDGLADWFKSIIKGIKDFSSSVGEWFSTLKDAFSLWFKDLGDNLHGWFTNVVDTVTGIPSTIIDGFKKLLNLLFVPSDGFLNDKISDLKSALAKRFHMETYNQMISALKGYVSGKLDFKGYVDLSPWLGGHLDTVKDFLRAFFYPLILLGDFKFLLWVIRGSTIAGTSGGGGSD